MSDANRAVFLSYASQDAEAAQRICDALRAAGVEVWFDQSELVGGDAWDGKIRGQIGSCALFVPVISAATQARREGYFRIEWRLAAQRTHAMADGTPFLLPIVIDETRDADALVPTEFKAVQWTRLTAGEAPEQFAARIHRILQRTAGRVETAVGASLDSAQSAGPVAGNAERRTVRQASTVLGLKRWFWPAVVTLVATVALLVGTLFWRARSPEPRAAEAEIGVVPGTKNGTAATLERIRSTLDQTDVTRAELDLAGEFLTRAVAADATNAEIFAAWTLVDCRYLEEYYDVSPERKEALRQHARRAQSLDGNAPAVKFARALSMVHLANDPATLTEARALFIDLLTAMPRNPEVPRQLAWNARARGEHAEAFEWLQRADALGDAHGSSAFQRALMKAFAGQYAEALQSLDTAIGRQRAVKYLLWKSYLQVIWLGDAAAARRTLAEVPAEYLIEDMPASAKYFVEIRARDYAAALATVRTVPRAYMASGAGAFSTGYYRGWALHLLGREAGAQSEWRSSLGPVEKLLQDQPNDWDLLLNRALLLSSLGEKAAATQVWKTAQELYGEQRNWLEEYLAATQLSADEAIARLERRYREHSSWVTAAELRLSPYYDRLREDPRFVALQAMADADPRCSPTASARGDAGSAANAPFAPAEKSVAVLAFANLSDDKSNEYFSDGISEELLNVLAKVPGLKVTARTSSFHFKGKDTAIADIARQLGVAYVVEGSVRKAGDKVRITAQLIKAADGFHVWSDTFTRDLKDIFAVQDEIAGLIAQNLRLKIGEAVASAPVDPEAYRLLLAGRAKIRQGGNVNRDAAIEDIRQAVALAPTYAAAWAELARVFIEKARTGRMDLDAAFNEARAAARQAAVLAPDAPEVLLAVGWVRRTADWDWRGAETAFRRALTLYPDHPAIVSGAALLFNNLGYIDESLRLGRRAAELDPLNAEAHFNRSFFLANVGKLADSEASLRRALALAPEGDGYHRFLSNLLAEQGRLDDADREGALELAAPNRLVAQAIVLVRRGRAAEAVAIARRLETETNYNNDMAEVYAQAGERDLAFAALERSYQRHETGMAWLKVDSYLRTLHDDPRWPVLLHKMGLSDDQLK